jgi:hypothetical protein
MSTMNPSTETPQDRSILLRMLGGVVVFFLLLAAIILLVSRIQERRRAAADEAMVRAAHELGAKIEISHVYFNTGENFLGDRVRYLNGVLTNHADRPLELIELTFTFVDQVGQTVLRVSKRPIDERKTALNPNELREFKIGFEKLPQDWNRQHPAIQITRLKFAK